MTLLWPLLAPAQTVASGSAASPTTAQVTIYSAGSFWKGGIPGNKHGSFAGRIMDEYDQLAQLTLGHYVTFDLDPGPHTFTANTWMLPHPEGGGHLTLDLVAGQHYFIGAYTQSVGPVSLFRLEQRTCQQAQEENEGTSPLDPKHLKSYGRAHLSQQISLPACAPVPSRSISPVSAAATAPVAPPTPAP